MHMVTDGCASTVLVVKKESQELMANRSYLQLVFSTNFKSQLKSLKNKNK